jgi:hypothetical protein
MQDTDVIYWLSEKHKPHEHAEFYRDALAKRADKLVMDAYQRGFFEAPASGQFHHAYETGLAVHSLEVFAWALRLAPSFGIDVSSDVAKISVMFHDLCKAGLYETYDKNVKDDVTGQWHKETAYRTNDAARASMGHGEESLRRIETITGYLPEGWAHAVRWHMGAFMLNSEDASRFTATCKKYHEVLFLHTCDMCSTTRKL